MFLVYKFSFVEDLQGSFKDISPYPRYYYTGESWSEGLGWGGGKGYLLGVV